MNPYKTLEFDQILETLATLALSSAAKEKLLALRPFLSEKELKQKILETTEAKKIIDSIGTPPLVAMTALSETLKLCEKWAMLLPEQLAEVAQFLSACKRMKSYLKRAESFEVAVAYYGGGLYELSSLVHEIENAIRNGAVDGQATPQLRDIRRKIENANSAVKAKLDSILRGKKEYFADSYVAVRNGRFVLPVKKEYKHQVSGSVIDSSGSGNTYFIEPAAVKKLVDDLELLKIDEDNEIRRILYTLTALVGEQLSEIRTNVNLFETLDFVFAKAKLSLQMNAEPAPVNTDRLLVLKKARHPLLDPAVCVPLDFEIGGAVRGVIITGPNTGGKTVALKTAGLLSLMAQCGLHIPAEKGSTVCMNANILCDIGDGQSISENLSTFSSHIKNVIEILKNTTTESLVILDELGSGTDPAEGMGIAVAILAELKESGCLFIATTHYPEIKEYAAKTEGMINARMAFDRESLKPLYQLTIGEAGESCALYIAQRLGLPPHMLKRAHKEAYAGKTGEIADAHFADLSEAAPQKPLAKSIIQKEVLTAYQTKINQFSMGDSVMILPEKSIGIVYKPENDKGEVIVQVKGQKITVNHKRVKLITAAAELYPDIENYDFSIIFDSVDNRKAKHQMGRKYTKDLAISYEDE
ncbi:MAG: DNA mismatch repair protein MutS [Clostridiales bacterium]|jgi:MutS2 family protein|nr:DNA mismatch repair protein MutS [Clostridiales bacterium]